MTNQPASAPYGASEKTNTMAIVALIGSIVGFSAIASILGFVALSQIKKTGEKGRGMAIAGIVIGLATLVLYIILIIGSVVLVANAPTTY